MSCIKCTIFVLTWCSVCFFASLTLAAPPNAGSLLREIRPLPEMPKSEQGVTPEISERKGQAIQSELKVKVSKIVITGAQAIPEEQLQKVVAGIIGQEVTLTELGEYVHSVTDYYRQKDYVLARAYLPPQKIKDGVVEIAILEGQVGKITIDNQSDLSTNYAKSKLQMVKEGHALEGSPLERELLLLSDLQGVKVSSTLRPGESVGTTDLDVSLESESPYLVTLFSDNYGSRFTGYGRVGGYLTIGNLAGIGDTLDLQAISSTDLHYARAAWQVPVGTRGTQIGTAVSGMGYKLIEEYKPLDASGTAIIASAYGLYPFIRSRNTNLNGQAVFEHKWLNDDIDIVKAESRKKVKLLTVGLSGDRVDGFGGGGVSQGSLSVSSGYLDLDSNSRGLDAIGYHTAGSFARVNVSFSRIQHLYKQWNVYFSGYGQLSNKNLDSAEKMGLGGPQGVRAYPQGEAAADDAWLASVELRYGFARDWSASLFYDRAQGKINHSPLLADSNNTRDLAGYGVGLSYQNTSDFNVNVSLAWRDGAEPLSDKDRDPRIWAQAIKRF